LGALLGSVGHKVKIHKITPVIEIKDYVVLKKTQGQVRSTSSSHPDFGFYYDPYVLWLIKLTHKWSAHSHKTFRWLS